MRILTLSMILIGLFQSTAYAELTLLKEQLFTESEESIQRRTPPIKAARKDGLSRASQLR
jgi:hypothetical protein